MLKVFDNYIKEIALIKEELEHSGRTFLENLLNSIKEEFNFTNLHIIHEAKRNQDGLGAPDFVVRDLKTISNIGFIETKKIGTNLDEIYKSAQIQKYIKLTNNLIVTNYLEFMWIYKGSIAKRETLCYISDLDNKKFKLNQNQITFVQNLIVDFFSRQAEEITKVQELAQKLARPSVEIKEYLELQIKGQQDGSISKGKLFGLYTAFKKSLFEDLTINQFADSFAQMLTYAMFLAKINTSDKLTLQNAKDYIPQTFNLIKTLVEFLELLNNNQHKEIQWAVEIILSVINNMNASLIAEELHFKYNSTNLNSTNEKDPYIYFYEDFLKEYDANLRVDRGVYYTPIPIVEFIVREVSNILQTEFNLPNGIANPKVKLLDFACGTGTFLLEVFRLILLNTGSLQNDSLLNNLVSNKFIDTVENHILKNVYGFELLISAYIISHLKLSQFLKEQGYDIISNEKRLGVYLTNTLEHKQDVQLDFLVPALGEEGAAAKKIKEDNNIIVILGNPPYNGSSQNNSDYIKNLIKPYFPNDEIKEKNPKWLQDDYVKFIRFAENKINEAGKGVVAIITNHSFLDNPTFRQMRKHLITTFDQIYIIDCHGNTKKKEKSPDGTADQNVFNIQQGVAISFFIKNGKEKAIYHHDVFGKRESKFNQVAELTLQKTNFTKINPTAPFYLLIPQNETLKKEYDEGWSLRDIFTATNVGIVTARDNFAIDINKDSIKTRLKDFIELSEDKARIKYNLGKDARDWKVSLAQNDVKTTKLKEQYFIKITYRPFDIRYTYYTSKTRGLICMPRKDIMQHFIDRENIGLVFTRQVATNMFNHCFITNTIIESCFISNATKEINYVTPLYTYTNNMGLETKSANFNAQFTKEIIKNKYSTIIPTPEQILGYIYAILHATTYRTKYLEFLKIDFPRIPFCNNTNKFLELSTLGQELIDTHLLKNIPNTLQNVECFIDKNQNNITVDKLTFNEKEQTLYFNKVCYFTGISKKVWEFKIGSYQVIDKYLKSRKARTLTTEEITHVTNIIKVLDFTITQMQKIDTIYNS